jgi:Skp family chaperone for outer membrane proteins
MILSAALGVAGILFSAGTAGAQPGAPGTPPAPAGRPTVAVFNMAAVMRDFGQAKYQVYLLNKRKDELSKTLVTMRGDYIRLQTELRQNPNHPQKDQIAQHMLDLARKIEDEDRKISKALNDDASAIISELYDKMKAVVDKTAEINGYHLIFAYPDAVTPEEQKSAYIKELKLKPPAAQPFFVAPHADITAVVVKTLNVWYPPVDPHTRQPVDMAKLEELMKAQPQPANGQQQPGGPGVPSIGPGPAPGGPGVPPGRPGG